MKRLALVGDVKIGLCVCKPIPFWTLKFIRLVYPGSNLYSSSSLYKNHTGDDSCMSKTHWTLSYSESVTSHIISLGF